MRALFLSYRQVAGALALPSVNPDEQIMAFEGTVGDLLAFHKARTSNGAETIRKTIEALGLLVPGTDTIRFFTVEPINGHFCALPVARVTNVGRHSAPEVVSAMARIGMDRSRNIDPIKDRTPVFVHASIDKAIEAAQRGGGDMAWANVAKRIAPNRQYLDMRVFADEMNSQKIVQITPEQLAANFPTFLFGAFAEFYGDNFTRGGAQVIPLYDKGLPWGYIELATPFSGLPAGMTLEQAGKIQNILQRAFANVHGKMLEAVRIDEVPEYKPNQPLLVQMVDPTPSWRVRIGDYSVVKAHINDMPRDFRRSVYQVVALAHSIYYKGFSPKKAFLYDPQSTYLLVLDKHDHPVAGIRVIHRDERMNNAKVSLPSDVANVFDPQGRSSKKPLEGTRVAELSSFFFLEHSPEVEDALRAGLHEYLIACGVQKTFLLVDPAFPHVLGRARDFADVTDYDYARVFPNYLRRREPGSPVTIETVQWRLYKYVPQPPQGFPARHESPAFTPEQFRRLGG